MYRFLFFILVVGLLSCSKKQDAYYYRTHPKVLQQAINTCEQSGNNSKECQEIIEIGHKLGKLAYELQKDPQAFGQKILTLQNTLAEEEQTLKNSQDPELENRLKKNKETLADYLIVVKWLESPEG